MALSSINPASGEVLESFEEATPAALERVLAHAWQAFLGWRERTFAERAARLREVARVLGAKKVEDARLMALEIERVFRAAGLPEGLFGTVLVGPAAVPALIADARIRAVTLTGSERAGSQVAERAGRELKKTVLELGGSDPFIVLEDADLPRAARAAASARLVNSGQSCIAAKRFIVVETVAERFLEIFVGEMRARKMGDPLARDTEVGPQARADLRDVLHRQVEESVKRGARLLLGGSVPRGPGAVYPPTLLTAVDKGMPAFDEETFGPGAAVVAARDEEDAIRLANDSTFGLGASLWTTSRERAERLAAVIEAGSVFGDRVVKADPRPPLRRLKPSGYRARLSGV